MEIHTYVMEKFITKKFGGVNIYYINFKKKKHMIYVRSSI